MQEKKQELKEKGFSFGAFLKRVTGGYFSLFSLFVLSTIAMIIGWNMVGTYSGYCDACYNQQEPASLQCYCNAFGSEPPWIGYPITHWQFWIPTLIYNICNSLLMVLCVYTFYDWHKKSNDKGLIITALILVIISLAAVILQQTLQNVLGDYWVHWTHYNSCEIPQASQNLTPWYYDFCAFLYAYQLLTNSNIPITIIQAIFCLFLLSTFKEGNANNKELEEIDKK